MMRHAVGTFFRRLTGGDCGSEEDRDEKEMYDDKDDSHCVGRADGGIGFGDCKINAYCACAKYSKIGNMSGEDYEESMD